MLRHAECIVMDGGPTCRDDSYRPITASPSMKALPEPTVFTTGDVARICQVAPRTVSKWFDTGQLKGYRIPGSLDRRIPRDSLVAFMRSHGMPLGELSAKEAGRVLLIALNEQESPMLQRDLQLTGIEFQSAASVFEAGSVAASFKPQCVVIDSQIGVLEAGQMARILKANSPAGKMRTIVLVDPDTETERWQPGWFDDRFRRPFDSALLAVRIRSLSEEALQ
jgi:hypothetical protein